MLAYLPPTTPGDLRMLYAGAKELMRRTAEVNRVLELEDAEDLEDIENRLKTDE